MACLLLLGLCLWAQLWPASSAAPAVPVVVEASVLVDGQSAVAATDEDFVCATLDWWPPEKCDYGTCSWGRAGLLNLDLDSNLLLNAVKALSPLKIRLGGTLQDKLVYDTGGEAACLPFVKNTSETFGFTPGCLPMSRWDQLNQFFLKAGAEVIFGLNAMNGRVPMSDGSVGGPWNCSNAASLIQYSANKGFPIHGWELGNELSGTGIGYRINADQYAADVITLKTVVDTVYRGAAVKPLVVAPGGFFDQSWFAELISRTKPSLLDVITHHIYNLGPGVDNHLIEKILDPGYLDGEADTFNKLQSMLSAAGTSTVAWVGEAGGAWNSGRHLVTDSFVFSFWFLDQLGMSSKFNTKAFCRQTLVGGNYGLLNTTTFEPNPDYYSALLWHRLMGPKVLSATFTGTNKIRAYAHCAKQQPGITLLLINLGNETVPVSVASTINYTQSAVRSHGRSSGLKPGLGQAIGTVRHEYHLTPDGTIQSQRVMLNGKVLSTDGGGDIPELAPVMVEGLAATGPVTVRRFSVAFVHFLGFAAPACG